MDNWAADYGYFAVGLLFFAIIIFIAVRRRQDRRWIQNRFGSTKVLAHSFGVKYFGRMSVPESPKGRNGFLLLFPDRLFFRCPRAKLELDIPGKNIVRVHHGYTFKGVDLKQTVVKVDFYNNENQPDTAAFRVPYPPQWMGAIETAFRIKKAPPDEQGRP
jgi:hypothetical protein